MVEILSETLFDGSKPLKMSLDIRVDGWILYNVRVLQSKEKPPWVCLPQRTWKEPDGKTQYRPLITPPPEVTEAIEKAVLARFEGKREKCG